MRPITLKMTAFGPYKGTETIDFRELKDHLLFVISGATGSGKTTIFDGICFALYGQASGEDRSEVRALRSHFADDDVQTAVELTFAIKDRTYRIWRQIPYTKKGNKSETLARVTFYELREEGEVPIVDRQIVTEINEKVESLIGFTQEQFSQIVMLPQGEFRKFLTSDTENKELIMRKIFKTDQYRTLVMRLKQQRDEAKTKLDSEKQQEQSIIQQISKSLPERASEIFHVIANEHYNTAQVIEGLEIEEAFYQQKIIDDRAIYEESYKKHGEMMEQYHVSRIINERFSELAQKQKDYAQLTEQIPYLEQQSKQLARAENAVTIEEIEYHLVELEKEYVAKEQAVSKANQHLHTVTEQLEKVRVQYQVAEEKQPRLEQVKEQLIRLQDALPKVKDLSAKKLDLKRLEVTVAANEKKREDLTKQAREESNRLTALMKEVEEKEQAIATLDEQVDLLTAIGEKSKAIDDYMALQKQVAAFKEKQQEQEQLYKTAQAAYEQLANDWLQGEAAQLAAQLHDGEACPVCGSEAHPKKAHESGESISKEQLEEKKSHLTVVESNYRMAVAHFESASTQLGDKAPILKDHDVLLDEIEREKAEITQEKARVQQEVTTLRSIRAELVQLKKTVTSQTKKAQEVGEEKQAAEKMVFETNASIQTIKALIAQITETVPEDLMELSTLEQKISELLQERNTIEHAWKSIQKQFEDSREQLTTATSNQTHAKASLKDVTTKKEQATLRFKDALAKSMFETKEAYEEAKMDELERKELRMKIEAFKNNYYAIRKEVKALTEQLEGKTQVDLQQIEQSLMALKSAYETAFQALNRSENDYKTANHLKKQLLQLVEKVKELEERFGKIEDLYDMIRGQNHLKISFERYIQIEYLEQMIQSANERLRQISNGQFELMRTDRQEGRGRQSGLGLDVYDAYTGQTRDVKTLSGGEKFNASLCLALGMADIIQSFQGAVSIDTMFIDEGFGTLDEESLAKAIDTLIDLQRAGRMIGVISHVEELKAALPAILEVKKAKEGYSETSFILK